MLRWPGINDVAWEMLGHAVIYTGITQGSRRLMGRYRDAVLAACKKQDRSSRQFLQNALPAYSSQTSTPGPPIVQLN